MKAKGAVACGHPATAAAAEEILRDGGNAFDAVLAAFAAATVAETVLSSLGGGGFHAGSAGRGARVASTTSSSIRRWRRGPKTSWISSPSMPTSARPGRSFTSAWGPAPRPAGSRASSPFTATSPACQWRASWSRPSDWRGPALRCAIWMPSCFPWWRRFCSPGRKSGPCTAAPTAPCSRAARSWVSRNWPIRWRPWPRKAKSLFYQGELAQRLVAACADRGGHLTAADLANYQVKKRRPLARDYHGTRILTNPPPSAGGILIAFALDLLSPYEVGRLPSAGAAQSCWAGSRT